jgi:hypothetical protein
VDRGLDELQHGLDEDVARAGVANHRAARAGFHQFGLCRQMPPKASKNGAFPSSGGLAERLAPIFDSD